MMTQPQAQDEPPEAAWRAYRAELVRFVRRRVEDDGTAEDIVHDVLVRAWERRASVRSRFEPWLYRIARNAIVDHYRARRPGQPLPEDLAAEQEAAPEVRGELAACILPLVERLPPLYREALTLAELQGLTQQQTADRLGVSLSGAKSRVQRARSRLRDLLLGCCRIELDHQGTPMDYAVTGGCESSAPAACPAGCATAA